MISSERWLDMADDYERYMFRDFDLPQYWYTMGSSCSKYDGAQSVEYMIAANRKFDGSIAWGPIVHKYTLTDQDLERYKDIIDWNAISRYAKLDLATVIRYYSRLDMTDMSYNTRISDDIVRKFHKELLMWRVISNKTISFELAQELLLDPDFKGYDKARLLEFYNFPEDILAKTLDNPWTLDVKKEVSRYQTLSPRFIEKNLRILNINHICRYQYLPFDFVQKHFQIIRWDDLSYNKKLDTWVATHYRDKLMTTEEVEKACGRVGQLSHMKCE